MHFSNKRNLFEKLLIDAAKPLIANNIASETTPKPRIYTQLTIEEDNKIYAVQYAGGYFAMKLLKKYKKLSSANAGLYCGESL